MSITSDPGMDRHDGSTTAAVTPGDFGSQRHMKLRVHEPVSAEMGSTVGNGLVDGVWTLYTPPFGRTTGHITGPRFSRKEQIEAKNREENSPLVMSSTPGLPQPPFCTAITSGHRCGCPRHSRCWDQGEGRRVDLDERESLRAPTAGSPGDGTGRGAPGSGTPPDPDSDRGRVAGHWRDSLRTPLRQRTRTQSALGPIRAPRPRSVTSPRSHRSPI